MRRDAQPQNGLDLGLAGAVEAGAQVGEQLQQHLVRVAFDGVVGLDAGQPRQPVYVLVADVFQVDDVEGVMVGVGVGVGGDALYVFEGIYWIFKSSQIKNLFFQFLFHSDVYSTVRGL